uniref:Uncharacterized protein n=1 Tax=viral metagenome TaxID=1070528 RepID=A0A6M3LQ54_9ZZZZ
MDIALTELGTIMNTLSYLFLDPVDALDLDIALQEYNLGNVNTITELFRQKCNKIRKLSDDLQDTQNDIERLENEIEWKNKGY